MTLTVTHIHDPGHGWLAVSAEDAKALGLSPADFTNCSFHHGDMFYLEEDCDAAVFYAAHHKRFGAFPTVRDTHVEGSWPGRNFSRFEGTSPTYDAAFAYLSSEKSLENSETI